MQNNEIEQQAGARIRGVYARVERNVYLFVAAMLVLILLTSLYLVQLQPPPVPAKWRRFRRAAANWRSN